MPPNEQDPPHPDGAAQTQVKRVARNGQHVALAVALVAGAVVVGGFGAGFHWVRSYSCLVPSGVVAPSTNVLIATLTSANQVDT